MALAPLTRAVGGKICGNANARVGKQALWALRRFQTIFNQNRCSRRFLANLPRALAVALIVFRTQTIEGEEVRAEGMKGRMAAEGRRVKEERLNREKGRKKLIESEERLKWGEGRTKSQTTRLPLSEQNYSETT